MKSESFPRFISIVIYQLSFLIEFKFLSLEIIHIVRVGKSLMMTWNIHSNNHLICKSSKLSSFNLQIAEWIRLSLCESHDTFSLSNSMSHCHKQVFLLGQPIGASHITEPFLLQPFILMISWPGGLGGRGSRHTMNCEKHLCVYALVIGNMNVFINQNFMSIA